MGRRMAEGAALLVDHVLPAVGYRQWVLSFPGPMAVRLGYDAPLLAAIAGRLARAVMQDMRRGLGEDVGEDVGEDSAGSLGRAKSSASCGGGGGAAGLGMTRSRRRWWLASTP